MKCSAPLSQEKLALVKIKISLIPHRFVIVGTKKRKMEGEKSSGPIENSEIESEQLEKTETSSSPKVLESQQEVDAAITTTMEEEDLKPLDKEVGIRDCVSPRKESATPCGGGELNAVEDVQDSTKG